MNATRYILLVLGILLLSIFCFSCVDDLDTRRDGNWCDNKTLIVTLNAPATQVISPMTKSAQKDTLLMDLNVLIYNKDGSIREGHYYDEANSSALIEALRKGEQKVLNLELGDKVEGYVYAIANYGKNIYNQLESLGDDKAKFGTKEAIEAATFGFNTNSKTPRLYMYANGGSFDVGDDQKNKVSLDLKRIYAMVTVKIEKNLKQPAGEDEFDIIPTSIQIKNIPTQGQFAPRNLIGVNAVASAEGEMILPSLPDDKNFLDKSHDKAQPFFIYENQQPDGSCLMLDGNKPDQTTKTPKGLSPNDIVSSIKTNRTCSYIEVHAKYVRDGKEGGIGSGSIIYRFFLGQDIYKNFDIVRNAHYQVTLTLNGKGGADEATWRVETKLNGEIQAPDVYVSYRAGSKVRMYVSGDVGDVSNIAIENIFTPQGGQAGFTVDPTLKDDKDGKGKYAEITVLYTNTHDYDRKIGQVTFTLSRDNGSVVNTQKAKVYQVPRLVDPIAIYKRAANDNPKTIVVKEFDKDAYPDHGAYVTLVSKGTWSAEIADYSGTSDCWFKIYNVGDPEHAVEVKNGKIEGEGDITFVYEPLSKNLKKDGDDGENDGARFGKILVKYHNESCEHEIFLRQGYQPTSFGDTYLWSSFNCLGKTENEPTVKGTVTQYPTQTGWLFNGNVNVAMHPFEPVYKEGNSRTELEYSDGKNHPYCFYKPEPSAWQEATYTTTQIKTKRGPCPAGYLVASAWTYRKMSARPTVIYTGYVHDDSNEDENGNEIAGKRGWNYETFGKDGGAIVDGSNNCNPAKGSLFVSDNGAKNLFFNYGKGVMTQAKAPLIPEIGIGHRFTYDNLSGDNFFGQLTYAGSGNAYGAYYWSAGIYQNSTHVGKVDLSYDMFGPYPSLIDQPGSSVENDPNTSAKGIHSDAHASFVRCVRDPNPEKEMIPITIKAKFYETDPKGIYKELVDGKYPYFIFSGKNTQVAISKGVISGKLMVEEGTSDDTSVTISLSDAGFPTYRNITVSLGNLQKEQNIVFINDVRVIDINAKFFTMLDDVKSVVNGYVSAKIDYEYTSIKVNNSIADRWLIKSSFTDNQSIELSYSVPIGNNQYNTFKKTLTIGELIALPEGTELILEK